MNAQSQRSFSATPGRRGRSRLRTSLPAEITSLNGTYGVEMEDISLTGARVRIVNRRGVADTPAESARLVLEWFGFEAFGEVSWVEKERIGMRFFKIIPPAVLIKTRDIEDGQLASKKAREDISNYMQDWSQGKVR